MKCSSYQLQLKAYYVLFNPISMVTFYTLETLTGQKVQAQLHSTFLFSSMKIAELLSVGLKSALRLLPILEIGKLHTLPLNFGG